MRTVMPGDQFCGRKPLTIQSVTALLHFQIHSALCEVINYKTVINIQLETDDAAEENTQPWFQTFLQSINQHETCILNKGIKSLCRN